jgi:hypothetical protein
LLPVAGTMKFSGALTLVLRSATTRSRSTPYLVGVLRRGLARPLAEGLRVEAQGLGECKRSVDYDIGMKNFIQNGPRVPAQS